ncbi:MAG: type VI-A CRISPR-associated RNA-guided ribonuclease Cas13a [Lachnospiraceae bacterium]|nr:type VI-A CRISPR-associated RNA-guided ribonuclease Cas13a [Lachnospiraceae bacterium]
MKIAKVNRIKTAVGIKKGEGSRGFLYEDPAREKAGVNVEQSVKDRANAAKVLYTVFREIKIDKNGNIAASDEHIPTGAAETAKNFNRALKGGLVTETRNAKGKRVKAIAGNLKAEKVVQELKKQNYKSSERDIDDAILFLLKNSLKKPDLTASLRAIMQRGFGVNPEAELTEAFPVALREDFNKTSYAEDIIRAVKNQNMVVQPDSKSGILNLTAADKSKKRDSGKKNNPKSEEKDALRHFMQEYAVIDDDKRHILRCKLRRLTDLFFYGEDAVVTGDFNEWDIHKLRSETDEWFVEIPDGASGRDHNEKNEKEKAKILKQMEAELKMLVRNKNMTCYRNSIQAAESDTQDLYFSDMDMNRFWIHYMEQTVEKIYKKIKLSKTFRYKKGYISEKVWKRIINYLSINYIAIGKAVYNYAMDELKDQKEKISLGRLPKDYENGISSFEYERIKAEETLQRETAVYVAFAANNLKQAVMKEDMNDSDMLVAGEKKTLAENAKPHILRNILQFFGGKSAWGTFFDGKDDAQLLFDMKQILYAMRNESFHFSTHSKNRGDWDTELIGRMFEKDCQEAVVAQKNKFYSNNLSMFYPEQALERVLHTLYSEYHERASQVPSFNTVFVRKNFRTLLAADGMQPAFTDDDTLKWENAVYYLFKEIYYNAFLPDQKTKKLFLEAVDHMPVYKSQNKNGREVTSKESKPTEDFQKAMEIYRREDSLSRICQSVMTEFNRQNTGGRKRKSTAVSKEHPDIYQHYKVFLHLCLQEAFKAYLKQHEDIYGFIRKPKQPSEEGMMDQKDFLPGYASGQYEDLIGLVKQTPDLQKWYVTGRLLNLRQINRFAGALRNYEQYVQDVERRAKNNGNALKTRTLSFRVSDAIRVLDLVTKINGIMSLNIRDYFDDEDDYAEYVSRFVDFTDEDTKTRHNASSLLAAFCESDVFHGQDEKIYHDGTNPILNRNILQAKLYGTAQICADAVPPVDEDTLKQYHNAKKNINAYQARGVCKSRDEQEKLNVFMGLKNRVELRDIVTFSEIITELYGQMLNWCYLRERDLLYFQLGFHYLCLHNEKEKKEETYYRLTVEDRTVEGAILMQIAGMYIHGVPVWSPDQNGQMRRNTGTGGKQIGSFLKYSEMICANNAEALYLAGMELFENIKEHDNVVALRNSIEHFHYFAKRDRSLLDLYGEIFDRLFTHDVKYRKNVVNMMYNILLSHFVLARFVFGRTTKTVGVKEHAVQKDRASVSLMDDGGMMSDLHTYSIDGGTPVKLPARSMEFLTSVARILYYPHCEDVTKTIVKENQEKNKNPVSSDRSLSPGKGTGSGGHHGNTSDRGKSKGAYKQSREEQKIVEEYNKRPREELKNTMGSNIDFDALRARLKKS